MSFLSSENLQILWDIIYEMDEFQYLDQDVKKHISDIFSTKIELFYTKNIHLCLLDLNKLYITQLLTYIHQIQEKYTKSNNKLIIKTTTNEPITFEELSNQKQQQFASLLEHHEKHFQDLMHVKPPNTPQFADNYNLLPLDFEKSIQDITVLRNYDELTYLNTNTNTNANAKNVQWGENSLIETKKKYENMDEKKVENMDINNSIVIQFLQKLKPIS